MTSTEQRDRLAGPSDIRVDGIAKVTGRARYAADIERPGLLWGKTLRSSVPHARIVRIDTSRVSTLPGVHAVLTGADLPDVRVGRQMRDLPVLARERVRFVGEKVAAVAAESAEVAEEACARIEVEYDPLPAIFDPIAAMDDDAPLLHTDTAERLVPTAPPATCRNGVTHSIWGESEEQVHQAIDSADRTFEHTFYVPLQHQGYLEPHACVVEAHEDGTIEVWASQKAPFLLRDYFRLGLGLRDEDVTVHIVPVGGDFGGKGSIMDAGLAYYLSKASGRPVKMIMSYAEELTAGDPRHSGTITMRTGVKQDGTLVGRHVQQFYASGAYAGMKLQPNVNLPVAPQAAGHYRFEHVRVESLMLYTNTVHSGHMRSPGGPQAAFVSEVSLDEVARVLELDALELRLRNAQQTGDPMPSGKVLHESRAREVLQAAAEAVDWHAPRRPYVGKGLALGEHGVSAWPYSAEIRVDRAGRIVVRTPLPEVGVGTHSVFREMVGRELGAPVGAIEVEANMKGMPYDRGMGGSRVTRLAGTANRLAARQVRERLLRAVAGEFGLEWDDLELRDGQIRLPSGDVLTLSEAAALAGGTVVEQVTYHPTEDLHVNAWCAQAAEVEIDPETGQVQVLRLASAHDVGEIINPLLHQGQIDGAVVQGLGAALMERMELQNGQVTSAHLGDYKLPSVADVPPLTTVLVPSEHETGVKPIGEGANCGLVAAIANAVAQVTGVTPRSYPILAEDVLAALRGRRGGS
jgi:carbon-monoxide dehydrogenase large subunit